ncbi:NlpC/P60 family protein [Paenibacillus sp. N1-5-1-14]|uniref:C40 family peptidase n=1 Tax=Paenibacillus radicibacter TaxID=2972488 RepID=UPI002159992C|nr:C40 family peptidase [Paenibacillus radicibacter]MCR8644054.1 NlpC/P60 family protein [Paenibacillus radicibacter]
MKKKLGVLMIASSLMLGAMPMSTFAAESPDTELEITFGAYAKNTYETTIEYGVNLRSTPSTAKKPILFLKKGEKVHVVKQVNANWLQVQTKQGQSGYISSNAKYTDYVAPSANTNKSEKIVKFAKSLMGKVTYKYGARDPKNFIFDCSSFTQYVYKEAADLSIKWGSNSQNNQLAKVAKKSDLRVGDLVFLRVNGTGIGHVGIYIGDGQMIHATPSANGVAISSLETGYWKDRFVNGGRMPSN